VQLIKDKAKISQLQKDKKQNLPEESKKVPLLIFANKSDRKDRVTVKQMAKYIGLVESDGQGNGRPIKVFALNALTGEGLIEGMHWLSTCMKLVSEGQYTSNTPLTSATTATITYETEETTIEYQIEGQTSSDLGFLRVHTKTKTKTPAGPPPPPLPTKPHYLKKSAAPPVPKKPQFPIEIFNELQAKEEAANAGKVEGFGSSTSKLLF